MSGQLRLLRYGEEAVLLEVPADRVPATYTAVRALLDQGRWTARDVVPGSLHRAGRRTVGRRKQASWPTCWRQIEPERRSGPVAAAVEVPTVYDGGDLDEVARLWDMTRPEAVRTHTGTDFTVAFLGFAPGFPYCTGLPDRLHVPRRDTPRARVPAGSVGLAGGFTGIYPRESPGGWQLLGHTDLRLWDSSADPPATLAPGTRVRFADAGGAR